MTDQQGIPASEEEPGCTFGAFRLAADGTLSRREHIIHLPPKELAALRLLLARAGKIVTPLDLKNALWGDVHVTADSITRCVSSLRARLQPEEYIQTVYKRGYRFSASTKQVVTSHPPAQPRLAIMPFAEGEHVPEHLGTVAAEETITRLISSRSVPVTVLARDSVFALAGQGLNAHEVGRRLTADLVLTGALRALPAHLRLRTEMIRVEDGAQIWVEDMLVPSARIAGVEAELADRLISRLGGGAPIAEEAAHANGHSESLQLKTFELQRNGIPEGQQHEAQNGVRSPQSKAGPDPSLTSAQVDLVHACITQSLYGFMSPAEAAEQARRAAAAIPDKCEAKTTVLPSLGWIRYHFDRELTGALAEFAASSHLPHDPWTTRARAMFALSRHRFDQAIDLIRAALVVDPQSPWLNARLAWAYHLAGMPELSVEQVERGLELFPGDEGIHLYGAMILAHTGDAPRAVAWAEELAHRSPYFDIAAAVHGYALAQAGRWDAARKVLDRLQWLGRERFVLSSFTPALCVALGETETAFAELRKAEKTRCPWFFQTLADPRLEPLRRHAEFVRMHRTWQHIEAQAERSGTSAEAGPATAPLSR
ncbi:MAG TPA: winged helix-turn-helix domain-containing protein [Terracidiphilus sp.]|nr:winged helix-turn-helix domain-containing protein [Terracidiphilus sp.]